MPRHLSRQALKLKQPKSAAWPPRRRGLFLFIPHENPSWILVKIDSILLASKLLTLPRRSARGFFWTSVQLEAALL